MCIFGETDWWGFGIHFAVFTIPATFAVYAGPLEFISIPVVLLVTTHQLSNSRLSTMPYSLCGGSIGSRRGLLASLWSVVSILTAVAFLTALVYALTTKYSENDNYNQYHNADGGGNNEDPELAVTSRALAFSALWTAVLSALMSVFGTVILGFQSPFSGQYYLCCDRNVHRTTPLGLGSFIGALLMLANLTLICSILFGEFEVREI